MLKAVKTDIAAALDIPARRVYVHRCHARGTALSVDFHIIRRPAASNATLDAARAAAAAVKSGAETERPAPSGSGASESFMEVSADLDKLASPGRSALRLMDDLDSLILNKLMVWKALKAFTMDVKLPGTTEEKLLAAGFDRTLDSMQTTLIVYTQAPVEAEVRTQHNRVSDSAVKPLPY